MKRDSTCALEYLNGEEDDGVNSAELLEEEQREADDEGLDDGRGTQHLPREQTVLWRRLLHLPGEWTSCTS